MSYKFIYNNKTYDLDAYSSKYDMWKNFFNFANMSDYGYKYTEYTHRQITYPYLYFTGSPNQKIHSIYTNYKCNKNMPLLIDCERTPIIPIRKKLDDDNTSSESTYVIDVNSINTVLDTVSFSTEYNSPKQIYIERVLDEITDEYYTQISFGTIGHITPKYKTTNSCITIVAQSAGGNGGQAYKTSKYDTTTSSWFYGFANGGGGGSGASIMFMIDLNHPTDTTTKFKIEIKTNEDGMTIVVKNNKGTDHIKLLLTHGKNGLDGTAITNNKVNTTNGIPPGDGGQIYYFQSLTKDPVLLTPTMPYSSELLVNYTINSGWTNMFGLIYCMCSGQAGGCGRLTYLRDYINDDNNGTQPNTPTIEFKPGNHTIAVPLHKEARTGGFADCTRGEGGYSCTTHGAGGCGGYGYTDEYGDTVDYTDTIPKPGYCYGQNSCVWIGSTSQWEEIK